MSDISPEEMEEARALLLKQKRWDDMSFIVGRIQHPNPNIVKAMEILQHCPVHGEGKGCPIDHGATRWAKAVDSLKGDTVKIEVREDTGAVENWVSPLIVEKLQLSVLRINSPGTEYTGFKGEKYKPTGEVNIWLAGKPRTSIEAQCLIAPEGFPIDGITFGTKFISEVGHVHTLFTDNKGESANLVIVGRKPLVG